MSFTTISVDVRDYIEDNHPRIPEADKDWIAQRIASKFDCTSLYEELEEWVSYICKGNNLPFGEEE